MQKGISILEWVKRILWIIILDFLLGGSGGQFSIMQFCLHVSCGGRRISYLSQQMRAFQKFQLKGDFGLTYIVHLRFIIFEFDSLGWIHPLILFSSRTHLEEKCSVRSYYTIVKIPYHAKVFGQIAGMAKRSS